MSDKISPKDTSRTYADLGTQALMRGDFPAAIEDLRKAITTDPKNSVAHNNLGLAYYGLGKKALAKKSVERAIELDHLNSDAHVNMGNFALEESNYALARSHYNQALENLEYKFRHRALTSMAQLALRENKTDEARRFLYQSIQANPDYCLSHFLLGSIFMRDGNAVRAAESFKKSVVATCNGNVAGHYQLGLAYMKNREYPKARSTFVYLIEKFPGSIQAQLAGDQLRNIP